ncbi:hypothetical protein MUK70_27785 [Dyadobacter chenwenxiniae]|uniref:Uncharacterized protein n=1 Tax=Dyadobacter chenwenxiniae TaxID=2906456 RepID=A0A9X1PQZ8_9BACT|nr:hypothetical protein [Dyadobacter chenwenxiniae]MCF0064083.1 hypothetical protein [Dyadobacter chenwenxiniae]UON82811.1 hypothetical protein MUK70_27785 [Dyadobacter chenwenxiniae]
MRDRTDILTDLVLFKGELSELRNELSQYSSDVEKPLITISKLDFSNILRRCIAEEISFEDLTDWANLIEFRDDLDFELAEMQELTFELASPEINGEISKERLKEMINELIAQHN